MSRRLGKAKDVRPVARKNTEFRKKFIWVEKWLGNGYCSVLNRPNTHDVSGGSVLCHSRTSRNINFCQLIDYLKIGYILVVGISFIRSTGMCGM